MKKIKFKHILLIILGLILLSISMLFIVNAIRTPIVNKKVNNSEIKMIPTIDFVQPYLFNDFSEDDYDKYFNSLSDIGYDTIIVQYTRSEAMLENSEGVTVHGNEFYYPTDLTEEDCDYIVIYDILGKLLDECEEHDFSAYIGLSVEELSWWNLSDYYNDEYMEHCRKVDCLMAREISALYGNKKAFIGWYFAFELFSNPIGWEKIWAKNVKAVVDTVSELDDRPLMLSPFRQIQLGLITDEYSMWKSFFKRAGLRENDIFCPQDSIGKLDSSGDPLTGDNHKKITNANLRRVYDYTKACQKACDKYNIKYYINCEMFRAVKGESSYLFVGDIERLEWQIKNASNIAEKLVTFSASHYMIDWQEDYLKDEYGNYVLDSDGSKIKQGIDTLSNRTKYLEDYKELINNYLNK